ncbi:MAG: esterase-like activity of phytase family protein [Goleter apudmare HA4340-LM2]|jgi:hypothetical protein|nr:esterase-like activity of phytase family protein [Goleter apudmare HA4340-LM2]
MQLIKKLLTLPKIIYFSIPILLIGLFFFFGNFASASVIVTGIEFIGQATLPTGLTFQKTQVGGFSGITYDAKNNLYYVISDDRSEKAPARFYTLKIDLSKGTLKDGDIVPVGVTTLLNENAEKYSPGTSDTEGIGLTTKETVFISSEGDTQQLINPFIKEFSISSGKVISTLPIPNKFLPDKNGKQGIRNNLAFESLTITPDQKNLFTVTENALIQDGTASQPKVSTSCRIIQYNLLTNQPEKEFLYQTQPVAPLLNLPGRFTSGLTDLVALDSQGHFLSLERTFTGLGFGVSLFEVSLEGAEEIQNLDSLLAVDDTKIQAVQKRQLLDLRTIEAPLDNLEGLTLGAKLPDGQPSLLLVSDNNFNSLQRTQILAFKLKIEPDFIRLLHRLFSFI